MSASFVSTLACSRGILFDFNGTLSDDEAQLERAYARAIIDLGYSPMSAAEYATLLGRSEPDIAASLIDARGGPTRDADTLLSAVAGRYRALCEDDPRVSDRTVSMVKTLRKSGRKVGIVTGTLRSLITPVLAERGLSNELDALVTIEDVVRGKPDPEGFLMGAELLGLSDTPADILVFEDSAAGVDAATRAGMPTVGIGPASGAPLSFATMDVAADAILGYLEKHPGT